MLFDEIHNKRLLQIMPLSTASFLFFSRLALLQKSFVIIVIGVHTPRSISSTWPSERLSRLTASLSTSLVSFLALSFSNWKFSVNERLVPVSRVDYQNIILPVWHCYCDYCCCRVRRLRRCRQKRKADFARERKNRNDFQSPIHAVSQVEARDYCGFPLSLSRSSLSPQ